MKVIIEAPFTINEAMDTAIKDKLDGLQKFENKISQANVFFKLDDGASPHSVTSEIRLRIPGNDLFASASSSQDMTAFNTAATQVKNQLLKRKEMMQDHR